MPAKDIYHEAVKHALLKEGWTITHDPLHLKWGTKDLYVDLGAERIIAAEKSGCKIGVEIKSFTGQSEIKDFEQAIGQYILYEDVLKKIQPERVLYLAIPDEVYRDVFEEPIGQLFLENHHMQLIAFDPENEVIVKWLP